MTVIASLLVIVVLVACAELAFHPVLRYLRLPEVPMALYACLFGRRYRRHVYGILQRRREADLDPSLPAVTGPLRRRWNAWADWSWAGYTREKVLVSSPAAATALRLPPRPARLPGHPVVPVLLEEQPAVLPRPALADLARLVELGYQTADEARAAARNPWARQLGAELAEHREAARWASLERNWRDIR